MSGQSKPEWLSFFNRCGNMKEMLFSDFCIRFSHWPVGNCSVAQLCLTLCDLGPQHARFPCPSLSPGVRSNSCPLSQWYHPTISSSVTPFSCCLQSFPASGSFPMSWLFTSGGQSIEASASVSVLPMNIQGLFPLGLTDPSSGFSRGWRFSNRAVSSSSYP